MKSKKKIAPVLIVVVIGIAIFASQKSNNKTRSPITPTPQTTPKEIEKIQECPDTWYKNMMPMIVDNPSEAEHVGEYFIIDNQRRELSEYDVEWIIENCEVNQPSPIN